MQILSMPLRHWALPQPGDIWVLSLSVLVVLPHLLYLPIAIASLCLMCWSLDLFLVSRRSRLSRMAKTGVILVVLSTLAITFSELTIFRLGFALAVLATSMKPLETSNKREHQSFVILCYICALLFFFQDGSAIWLLYYLCCLIGVTGLLFPADTTGLRVGKALRSSFWLLAQALPVAIVLFYGIPRIEKPFLQWNTSRSPAFSGVPDRVRLDRLGPMSESDEVAFEATFDGPAPDPFSLYWRGTVFYFTDGRTWDSEYYSHHPMAPERLASGGAATTLVESGSLSLAQRAGKTVTYRINTKAPSDSWLIALDLPVTQTDSSTLTEDYQLIPHRSFGSNFEYSMTSALSIRTPGDSRRVYSKALHLPSGSRLAREARSMGEELRAEHKGEREADQKIIQQVLRFFSQEPFYYTLNAPIYRNDPIDQFLFEGRYGYCTHYAAAMTLLLRAADVPARMISGYHGGDWSLNRKKLIVRQRHAHAWVEAWVEGHGWLRFDPTAAIPLDRVLTGSIPVDEMSVLNHNDQLLSQGENASDWQQFLNPSLDQNTIGANNRTSGAVESGFSFKRLTRLPGDLWTAAVRDFDRTLQQNLFGGAAAYLVLAAILLGTIAFHATFAAFRTRRNADGSRPCRVGALYDLLCRRLNAGGISVFPHEPYQVLQERLAETGRFDPEQLSGFFGTYERLRYRQQGTRVSRQELRLLRKKMKHLLAG